MSYKDTIDDNTLNHSPIPWWPKFAYHYTDVTNAVSILNSGYLYSRANAQELGMMKNENASRQVIDMTSFAVRSCARMYFRPLTPTQYYNEGFKHPQLRYDNDPYANTPVPVFFLFDLNAVLSTPGVRFSATKQAGAGSALMEGEEAFAALPFDRIYSQGPENFTENKAYRHAELLYPNAMPIRDKLTYVLCRNSIERNTLLSLLQEKDEKAFYTYHSMIKVCKSDMFENNGIFFAGYSYGSNSITLNLSDTYSKKKYTAKAMLKNGIPSESSLNPIQIMISLRWMNSKRLLYKETVQTLADYCRLTALSITGISKVPNAKTLRIEAYIENNLMCRINHPLEDVEVIK